jgi:hypothetical protein
MLDEAVREMAAEDINCPMIMLGCLHFYLIILSFVCVA